MYTINEFIERVEKSKGLVCYGIGKRFRTFEKCFDGTALLDKVRFCIDQDKQIQGTNIIIGNKEIEVFSNERLAELKSRGLLLLVTNLRYEEIIPELKKYNLRHGSDYFCFTHLYGMILEEKTMTKKVPDDYRITKEPVIPKMIHYCWFGRNPLPDRYKRWMESWHKFCPDYDIIEWNEDNYDITKNRYMYEAYQCKKWGFVPDYARLDIIYKHGGIYLDTDVELVQNLDDMLYQNGFLGFERENYIALGLGFGAIKGLSIIKEMLDQYDNLSFINPDGSLNLTASPEYQTKILVEHGLQLNGEYQVLGDLVVYPEKMFSGKCPYTRRVRLTSYTKSVHHYDASWTDDDWKKRNEQFEFEMNH